MQSISTAVQGPMVPTAQPCPEPYCTQHSRAREPLCNPSPQLCKEPWCTQHSRARTRSAIHHNCARTQGAITAAVQGAMVHTAQPCKEPSCNPSAQLCKELWCTQHSCARSPRAIHQHSRARTCSAHSTAMQGTLVQSIGTAVQGPKVRSLQLCKEPWCTQHSRARSPRAIHQHSRARSHGAHSTAVQGALVQPTNTTVKGPPIHTASPCKEP